MTALLGPVQIRRLADALGVRPTKKLGQNFVHDPNTVRRIVAAAELDPADTVLEVGPGLGSLTCALLPEVERVIAVEIDPVLAERLPQTIAEHVPDYAERLTVHASDALRLRAGDLPQPPTAMVANLPYNVAVPVLLHALTELPSLRSVLVMVQSEVADRIAAGPGSRVYGAPSVKTAWFAAARRAGAVPRSVFWPVPNVDSALVALHARPAPSTVSRDLVFALIDAAFATRRKMLRGALAGWAGSVERAVALLVAAGVDPAARGEQLDVTQFAKIAEAAQASV